MSGQDEPRTSEQSEVASPSGERPDVVLDVADAAASRPAVVASLVNGGDPVLIADDGEMAALVSAAGLADVRRLRRAERRRAALAELERLNAEWAASGLGYDEEEAERIGKELGKEVNRAITERLHGRAGDARRAA